MAGLKYGDSPSLTDAYFAVSQLYSISLVFLNFFVILHLLLRNVSNIRGITTSNNVNF